MVMAVVVAAVVSGSWLLLLLAELTSTPQFEVCCLARR
jgi:hypothetical protein